jgi:hypothetical protein
MNTLLESRIVLEMSARALATVRTSQPDLRAFLIQALTPHPIDRAPQDRNVERVGVEVLVDFSFNVLFYEEERDISLELGEARFYRPPTAEP